MIKEFDFSKARFAEKIELVIRVAVRGSAAEGLKSKHEEYIVERQSSTRRDSTTPERVTQIPERLTEVMQKMEGLT